MGRGEGTPGGKGGSLKLWALHGQEIGKELNVAPGGLVLRAGDTGRKEYRIAMDVLDTG